MVRFHTKDGSWTHADDDALKAGIIKYGLNSWGSIASLFSNRTPKDCQERWEKHLKTSWSPTDEENLIHLAHLFSGQWQVIAPLINKTPQQCYDVYKHLANPTTEPPARPGLRVRSPQSQSSEPGRDLYSQRTVNDAEFQDSTHQHTDHQVPRSHLSHDPVLSSEKKRSRRRTYDLHAPRLNTYDDSDSSKKVKKTRSSFDSAQSSLHDDDSSSVDTLSTTSTTSTSVQSSHALRARSRTRKSLQSSISVKTEHSEAQNQSQEISLLRLVNPQKKRESIMSSYLVKNKSDTNSSTRSQNTSVEAGGESRSSFSPSSLGPSTNHRPVQVSPSLSKTSEPSSSPGNLLLSASNSPLNNSFALLNSIPRGKRNNNSVQSPPPHRSPESRFHHSYPQSESSQASSLPAPSAGKVVVDLCTKEDIQSPSTKDKCNHGVDQSNVQLQPQSQQPQSQSQSQLQLQLQSQSQTQTAIQTPVPPQTPAQGIDDDGGTVTPPPSVPKRVPPSQPRPQLLSLRRTNHGPPPQQQLSTPRPQPHPSPSIVTQHQNQQRNHHTDDLSQIGSEASTQDQHGNDNLAQDVSHTAQPSPQNDQILQPSIGLPSPSTDKVDIPTLPATQCEPGQQAKSQQTQEHPQTPSRPQLNPSSTSDSSSSSTSSPQTPSAVSKPPSKATSKGRRASSHDTRPPHPFLSAQAFCGVFNGIASIPSSLLKLPEPILADRSLLYFIYRPSSQLIEDTHVACHQRAIIQYFRRYDPIIQHLLQIQDEVKQEYHALLAPRPSSTPGRGRIRPRAIENFGVDVLSGLNEAIASLELELLSPYVFLETLTGLLLPKHAPSITPLAFAELMARYPFIEDRVATLCYFLSQFQPLSSACDDLVKNLQGLRKEHHRHAKHLPKYHCLEQLVSVHEIILSYTSEYHQLYPLEFSNSSDPETLHGLFKLYHELGIETRVLTHKLEQHFIQHPMFFPQLQLPCKTYNRFFHDNIRSEFLRHRSNVQNKPRYLWQAQISCYIRALLCHEIFTLCLLSDTSISQQIGMKPFELAHYFRVVALFDHVLLKFKVTLQNVYFVMLACFFIVTQSHRQIDPNFFSAQVNLPLLTSLLLSSTPGMTNFLPPDSFPLLANNDIALTVPLRFLLPETFKDHPEVFSMIGEQNLFDLIITHVRQLTNGRRFNLDSILPQGRLDMDGIYPEEYYAIGAHSPPITDPKHQWDTSFLDHNYTLDHSVLKYQQWKSKQAQQHAASEGLRLKERMQLLHSQEAQQKSLQAGPSPGSTQGKVQQGVDPGPASPCQTHKTHGSPRDVQTPQNPTSQGNGRIQLVEDAHSLHSHHSPLSLATSSGQTPRAIGSVSDVVTQVLRTPPRRRTTPRLSRTGSSFALRNDMLSSSSSSSSSSQLPHSQQQHALSSEDRLTQPSSGPGRFRLSGDNIHTPQPIVKPRLSARQQPSGGEDVPPQGSSSGDSMSGQLTPYTPYRIKSKYSAHPLSNSVRKMKFRLRDSDSDKSRTPVPFHIDSNSRLTVAGINHTADTRASGAIAEPEGAPNGKATQMAPRSPQDNNHVMRLQFQDDQASPGSQHSSVVTADQPDDHQSVHRDIKEIDDLDLQNESALLQEAIQENVNHKYFAWMGIRLEQLRDFCLEESEWMECMTYGLESSLCCASPALMTPSLSILAVNQIKPAIPSSYSIPASSFNVPTEHEKFAYYRLQYTVSAPMSHGIYMDYSHTHNDRHPNRAGFDQFYELLFSSVNIELSHKGRPASLRGFSSSPENRSSFRPHGYNAAFITRQANRYSFNILFGLDYQLPTDVFTLSYDLLRGCHHHYMSMSNTDYMAMYSNVISYLTTTRDLYADDLQRSSALSADSLLCNNPEHAKLTQDEIASYIQHQNAVGGDNQLIGDTDDDPSLDINDPMNLKPFIDPLSNRCLCHARASFHKDSFNVATLSTTEQHVLNNLRSMFLFYDLMSLSFYQPEVLLCRFFDSYKLYVDDYVMRHPDISPNNVPMPEALHPDFDKPVLHQLRKRNLLPKTPLQVYRPSPVDTLAMISLRDRVGLDVVYAHVRLLLLLASLDARLIKYNNLNIALAVLLLVYSIYDCPVFTFYHLFSTCTISVQEIIDIQFIITHIYLFYYHLAEHQFDLGKFFHHQLRIVGHHLKKHRTRVREFQKQQQTEGSQPSNQQASPSESRQGAAGHSYAFHGVGHADLSPIQSKVNDASASASVSASDSDTKGNSSDHLNDKGSIKHTDTNESTASKDGAGDTNTSSDTTENGNMRDFDFNLTEDDFLLPLPPELIQVMQRWHHINKHYYFGHKDYFHQLPASSCPPTPSTIRTEKRVKDVESASEAATPATPVKDATPEPDRNNSQFFKSAAAAGDRHAIRTELYSSIVSSMRSNAGAPPYYLVGKEMFLTAYYDVYFTTQLNNPGYGTAGPEAAPIVLTHYPRSTPARGSDPSDVIDETTDYLPYKSCVLCNPALRFFFLFFDQSIRFPCRCQYLDL